MVPFSFGGHDFLASAEGALFWPARRALLVADLHLEKASWFARLGQFLPPYDSHATLARVAGDIARFGATRLYCLGDSFHDRSGSDRLPAEARALLMELTGRVEWWWITGNHDAGLLDRLGGRLSTEEAIDGLVLRHEAEPGEDRFELSGHFHPKLRVRARGRQVSRRCFVMAGRKLILPAYGALTGGLDAHHPEILRIVGPGATALVPGPGRMLRFPIAA